MPSQTTPEKISNQLRSLCKRVAGALPFSVDVTPWGRSGDCFTNCADYLTRHPGRIIHGWVIWEDVNLGFIEFEHHSIVKLEDGTFLGVTAFPDGETKVLFVPGAPRAEYVLTQHEGFVSAEVRVLTNHQFQRAIETPGRWSLRLVAANLGPEVKTPEDFWVKYPALKPEPVVEPHKPAKGANVGPKERCPCGSGKKFKRCCGS